MSERSSAQTNTPTSANMQYGYTPPHFDPMNLPPMQNTNDVYSYYAQNLYPTYSTFDEQLQWGSTDTPGNVPPAQMQFHHSLYTPSPIDIPRSPFDYPPAPHHYPHYHHPFPPSSFAPPQATGASGFDLPWNHPNMQMQAINVAPQPSMAPIGVGIASNKKLSTFDDHSAGAASDILAQQFHSSVNMGANSNHDETNTFDNGNHDNPTMLSSKEQQQYYQSGTNNISLVSSRSSHAQGAPSNGPKSYASVVSADTLNPHSNKSTPSVSNVPARSSIQTSNNEHPNPNLNFANEPNNLRSNQTNRTTNNFNNMNNYNQYNRNGSAGYNPRDSKQSNLPGGNVMHWTNNNSPTNTRGNNQNNNSTTFYNNQSSDYYKRSAYSQQHHQQHQQQQQSLSSSTNYTNNKRNNYHQQNYGSSRSAHSASNGNAATSADLQQSTATNNQEVLDALKRTHQYNPAEFNLNPKGARFFVIKSYSEDDVHRSIKYNIWCSTEHGNKRLDTAFREREGKGPLYLFFSVNASGHFCGMAEMMSPVDYEHKTDVWYASNKWHGKFEVKWIYVKDVPNQQFRSIRLENNDNKPVTNSRDTQEIPYEKGRLMLRNMHTFPHKTSIFDDFQYYESKQAEEKTKKSSNTDQNNNNYTRGVYNNKRQYASNRTAMMHNEQQQHEEEEESSTSPQQQQQQQQQTVENIQQEDEQN